MSRLCIHTSISALEKTDVAMYKIIDESNISCTWITEMRGHNN